MVEYLLGCLKADTRIGITTPIYPDADAGRAGEKEEKLKRYCVSGSQRKAGSKGRESYDARRQIGQGKRRR